MDINSSRIPKKDAQKRSYSGKALRERLLSLCIRIDDFFFRSGPDKKDPDFSRISEETLRSFIPSMTDGGSADPEEDNEEPSFDSQERSEDSREDLVSNDPKWQSGKFAVWAAIIGTSCLFPRKVLAQDAVGFINETHSQILSIGSVLYQVVVAIMGIIALISLITLAIRIQNSDREGASKATGWFAIMIFCIVMCVVIKNYMGF